MAAEEKITAFYRDAPVREKIEIILDHYPDFDSYIEGLQELLAVSIQIDRRSAGDRDEGQLGIRVQTSNCSDPTADAAISNVMLMNAIQSGDLDEELENVEDAEEYREEAETIRWMKEDYRVVRACILVLPSDKAHVLRMYYSCKSEAKQISSEESFSGSFYTRLYRVRKQIKDSAEKTLNRKYGRKN